MVCRYLSIIIGCFLINSCASWIQEFRNNETPISTTPVPWFTNPPMLFKGAKIKAGYSQAHINPKENQWLAGYEVGRKSKGIAHPLLVQCLALEDSQGEKLMIVTLDLLGVLPDFTKAILQKVHNWPKNRILFCSSHTHSAPDFYGIWGNGPVILPFVDGRDYEYIKQVQNTTIEVIKAAASGLSPAKIRFGCGKIPTTISKGRKGNSPDSTMAIIQIAFFGHYPITLVNYALHPDVLRGKYISPDFVHFMRSFYEASSGGKVMFVNAAVGAVQSQKNPPHNWQRAQNIGKILAQNIAKIMKKPIVPQEVYIRFFQENLKIQVKGKFFRIAMALGLLANLVDKNYTSSTAVYHIKLGPAQILTAPGELFPERWQKIKAKLKGNPKMLFGLTNVSLGYIMSNSDFRSGNHKYHASMAVSPEIGEDLIEVYKKLLSYE